MTILYPDPPSVMKVAKPVAEKVRKRLFEYAQTTGIHWSLDRVSLAGFCAIGSYTLLHCLRAHGVRSQLRFCRLVHSGGHCWVAIRSPDRPDFVVDVTATQFGIQRFPEVYIAPETEARCCESINCEGKLYSNNRKVGRRAFDEIFNTDSWREQAVERHLDFVRRTIEIVSKEPVRIAA